MSKLPCYHIESAHGHVYGVAATTVKDALTLCQERLTGESGGDVAVKAKRVDSWDADYGTVLQYT